MGDRIAIENCSFWQAINYQDGDPAQKTGGLGPTYMGPASNFIFRNNSIGWATGQNSMNDLVNAVIENNVFWRSASDYIIVGPAQALDGNYSGSPVHVGDRLQRAMGRQLAINFGKNVVVQNNTFKCHGRRPAIQLERWRDHPERSRRRGPAGGHRHGHGGERLEHQPTIPNAPGHAPGSILPAIRWSSSSAGPAPANGVISRRKRAIHSRSTSPSTSIPAVGDHFTVSYPAFENAHHQRQYDEQQSDGHRPLSRRRF